MIRPAGYSSDEDSDAEYESGFEEDSRGGRNFPVFSFRSVMETGTLEDIRIFLSEIDDYPNYVLDNGLTLPVFAADRCEPDKLQYLLNHERDNYPAKFPQTKQDVLVTICSKSVSEFENPQSLVVCFELLVTYDVDLHFKDRYGVNALMLACKYAPVELIESLLNRVNTVNEIDNDGWSPLFYAVNRGDANIISLLLKNGAKVDLLDRKNRYAYSIAMDKNFTDVANLVKPSAIAKRESDDGKNVPMPSYNSTNTVLEEDDTLYLNQVLEMVASTANDTTRYTSAFSKNKISLRQFLSLKTDDEVRDAGVLFSGHRKIMLNRIKEFHLRSWSPSSLGYTGFNKDDDSSDGLRTTLTFTASLHLQLYVLRCTLDYVKNSMKDCEPQTRQKIVSHLKKMRENLSNFSPRLIQLRSSVDAVQDKCAPFLAAQLLTDEFHS